MVTTHTSHPVSCFTLFSAVGCHPLFASTQSACSLSFLCRYKLPLPPHVFLDGKLLDFMPSRANKNATLHPCGNIDRHCIVLSGGVGGHMILINLSLPLLGCQSDMLLAVQYHSPLATGCSITLNKRVSTIGESLSPLLLHASTFFWIDMIFHASVSLSS